MLKHIASGLIGIAFFTATLPALSAEPLMKDELHDLVINKTAACRKEKDDSTCVNYFSAAGEVVQVLDDSGKRRDGRWFLDDADRLCILWNGKLKPLCFVVTENTDGTYNMVKRGKHVSTILKLTEGNINKL